MPTIKELEEMYETNRLIKEDLNKGLSVNKITKKHYVSTSRVIKLQSDEGFSNHQNKITKKINETKEMIAEFKDGKTTTQLGKKYDITKHTVRKRIIAEGVKMNEGGQIKRTEKYAKQIQIYLDQGKSVKEIEVLLGISNSHAYGIIRQYNLTPPKMNPEKQALISKTVELRGQGNSQESIARILNIGQTTVSKYLKLAGIDCQKPRLSTIKRNQEIYQLRQQGKSYAELAELYDVTISNISRIIRLLSERDGVIKGMGLIKDCKKEFNRNIAVRRELKQGVSMHTIAIQYNLSSKIVERYQDDNYYKNKQEKLLAKIKDLESILADYMNGMTITDIAKKRGDTRQGIHRKIKAIGVPKTRGGIEVKKQNKKEQVKTLYQEGKSAEEVSQIVGLSISAINAYARSMGFSFEDNTKSKKLETQVLELFTKKGKRALEIEKILGVNRKTIYRILNKHNIHTRLTKAEREARNKEICHLHIKGVTKEELSKRFGLSANSINKILKEIKVD